jgi:hypothetical protein
MTIHTFPAVLNVEGRPGRLLPGAHLSAAAAEAFAGLVASAQPEHFRDADRPVLEALAMSIVITRELESELAARGAVDLDGKVSPLVRHLRAQHGLIASLSVRLRLTPSSRADRKTAFRTATGAESISELYDRVSR